MSKNTGNTKFRKLDVSPYSDDEDVDDTPVDVGAQGPSENEVQSMLSQYPCWNQLSTIQKLTAVSVVFYTKTYTVTVMKSALPYKLINYKPLVSLPVV